MNSGHQQPPSGARVSDAKTPAAFAARTSRTKLASSVPAAADASAISADMSITAAGDAPKSTRNAKIPTVHITASCAAPRCAAPANLPNTIASRRVPFAISRSSVFVCRSRAIASALIAAVKNTNIVR